MILSMPTGLYNVVLPKKPADSMSVVYTISSTDPPRSVLDVSPIPAGMTEKLRSARVISDNLRRNNLGPLVFTTKINNPGFVVTGNSLFYLGQVLDFNTSSTNTIIPVNSGIETEHDTHYVDPASVGLEASDLDDVEMNAIITQKILLAEIEVLQKRKDNLDVDVVSQKKVINECARIIDAVDVILVADPENQKMLEIKQEMEQTKEDAEKDIQLSIEELNELPALVSSMQDQLRALAPVID